MVFYYTLPPKAHARGFQVYMGRDKYENEELLKYGWKEDVWFHVEGISSAHVYLRLPEGVEWDAIPPVVMKFCCQLVKNNSIEGCKKKECWVIYTPFPNLHKDTNTMQTGAVSFHKESLRKRVLVEKDRELVRTCERTKEERVIDLAEELRMHEWEVLQKLKKERKRLAQEKAQQKKQQQKLAYEESPDRFFEKGNTSTMNKGALSMAADAGDIKEQERLAAAGRALLQQQQQQKKKKKSSSTTAHAKRDLWGDSDSDDDSDNSDSEDSSDDD